VAACPSRRANLRRGTGILSALREAAPPAASRRGSLLPTLRAQLSLPRESAFAASYAESLRGCEKIKAAPAKALRDSKREVFLFSAAFAYFAPLRETGLFSLAVSHPAPAAPLRRGGRECVRDDSLRLLLNSPQVIFAEKTLRVEFVDFLGT